MQRALQYATATFKATDPRDKIYGLYGIREFQFKRPLHLVDHFFAVIFMTHQTTLTMNNATTEERIALAMSELSKQTKPNIMEASKKYKVNCTTLSRRFKGIQRSQAQFLSKSRQCLTNIEEKVVLDWINNWTEQFIPPTSCMVHSIAEEVSGVTINKN
jgi:hypothetical protein